MVENRKQIILDLDKGDEPEISRLNLMASPIHTALNLIASFTDTAI